MPTTKTVLERVRRRGYLVGVLPLRDSLALLAIPLKRGLEQHVTIDRTDEEALHEAALTLAQSCGLDVSDLVV